jgi:TMEM175 potassium channel family protein
MQRRDLARLVAFSDGVMAVAITLLVLNIDAPHVSEDDLGNALVDLIPSFLAYGIAFALVGRYWVIHHNLFETFVNFDGRLMALNLTYLMLIVLVPFSANLIDNYGGEPLAAATFATTLGLAAFVNWLMTAYALRRGMVHEARREETSPFGSPVALGFSAVFFLSVPVAFVSVPAAWVLWASTIVLRYPLRTVGRRASP